MSDIKWLIDLLPRQKSKFISHEVIPQNNTGGVMGEKESIDMTKLSQEKWQKILNWDSLMDAITAEVQKRLTKQMADMGLVNFDEKPEHPEDEDCLERSVEYYSRYPNRLFYGHEIVDDLVVTKNHVAAIIDRRIEEIEGEMCTSPTLIKQLAVRINELRCLRRQLVGEKKHNKATPNPNVKPPKLDWVNEGFGGEKGE